VGQHPRLVVTGGGGQLGRALASLLPGADVTFLDLPGFDLAAGETVTERIAALSPEVIIHAGAYTAVDAAEADPAAARAVNVDGTARIARAAGELGALLVYVSTDYVFAGDSQEPYPVDAPTGPLSVYGETKLGGEQAVAALERHLIVRTSWVFGEGKNFIRAILGAAAAQPGRELTVVDDQRGRPTYALDLAGGLLALVNRFEPALTGTYHLQNGGEPGTWADVAEVALEAAGLAATVRRISTAAYNEGRPGPIAPRPANGVLDCSRAAALGVSLRPWRDAVDEYVRVSA
jgi:dTDP-4-dehydrorhamnose reductase